MTEQLDELKRILNRSSMYYSLKYENDINNARLAIYDALRIMKSIEEKRPSDQISSLEKIHKEFDNYYRLKKQNLIIQTSLNQKK
jgi:hypothetical protein